MFLIQLAWLYLVNWDTELFYYLIFFKLLPRARLPLCSGCCTYLHQLRSLSNNIFEETWMSCTWKRMWSSEYEFCMRGLGSLIWRCNNVTTLLTMRVINNYSAVNFQSTRADTPELWGCWEFKSRLNPSFVVRLMISILIYLMFAANPAALQKILIIESTKITVQWLSPSIWAKPRMDLPLNLVGVPRPPRSPLFKISGAHGGEGISSFFGRGGRKKKKEKKKERRKRGGKQSAC